MAVAHSLLTLSCTVLSVALMWRRDRRETRSSFEHIQEQLQLLRSNAISHSIAVLRISLSPLRRLYLHLDDDERLDEELKLVFAKPEVSRAIRDSYAVVIEFDSLHPHVSPNSISPTNLHSGRSPHDYRLRLTPDYNAC